MSAPQPSFPPTAAPQPAAGHRKSPPQRVSGDRKWREIRKQLNPGQLVCWEVALVVVALSLWQPWPITAAAVILTAALVILTAVRLRGRWLYELVVLACRFLVRNRRHDLPEHSGTALALLSTLQPGSTTQTLETSQGPVMAISHPQGLTGIIRPRTFTSEQITSFPTPTELLSGDTHEFGVQAVFHSGTQPGTPIRLWLAVHAQRTVDMPTDEELALTLRNRLRRVRRVLQRAGVATEPLPEDFALAELTGLAHITGGRTEIRESWYAWRTGTVSQACFALENTGTADIRQLVTALLGRTRGVAVTLTLSALPGSGGSVPLLRLAAGTELALDAAADHLATVLSPSGVHLTRLDGTHFSGVAASLPIGGFPR